MTSTFFAALVTATDASERRADAAPIAELWVEPGADRDLFHGVGGPRLAPRGDWLFEVTAVKRSGFSDGYDLKSPDGREWSAKFPPEAHSEVTASRLHWGIGYHQPPVYLLLRWEADGAVTPNPQLPARFREDKPDLHGLARESDWSYHRNPFVGTVQLKGLLILQAMLGNRDLKDEQNAIYSLTAPREGASRWYVVRDLGQSLGRTSMRGTREGDVEAFARLPFIASVSDGRVRFAQIDSRVSDLYADIRPADVRWLCRRLARLTDAQLADAFRAGGYPDADARRFILRLKQKIVEGLSLKG
jgi:hypothetical protein